MADENAVALDKVAKGGGRRVGSPVARAISRAREALLDVQRPHAAWEGNVDLGPTALAMQLVVERRFGVLSGRDAREAVRALAACQRRDGSFDPHPRAARGTLTATATVYAGLVAAGQPDGEAIARSARAFLDRHGGFAPVKAAFRARGDLAAIFLLLAGCIEDDFLPRIPLAFALAPIDRLLDRSIHAGNIATMMTILALAARGRQEKPGPLRATLRLLERARVASYLCEYQNAEGSWNGITIQTLLMLVGLDALGLTASDARVARALAWLDGQKRREPGGLAISGFGNDMWSTAFAVLALREAGAQADDPRIERAVAFLLEHQVRTPQRPHLQRKRGARRTGGWAFERGNESMPDTDDTGIVLAALGAHARARPTAPVLRSIDDAIAWLRDMQNPDGGWPGFTWGLPGKNPGPMFLRDLEVNFDDPRAIVRFFLDPPAEYGDPATEGITGRVLWGLGACGVERNDPAVCRAIAFLQRQQCESGAWWGRWLTCYLPDTATIVLGLHAVGEDMAAPYVRRALRWLLSVQNPDGGWGETPEAYRDPSRAGRGPSMPALTGYVLSALCEAGGAPRSALDRAAAYLVAAQTEEGAWPNNGWLHTFLPHDIFYEYDFPARCIPLLALGKYRRLDRAGRPR